MERERRNVAALFRFTAGQRSHLVLDAGGFCHRPALAASDEAGLAVAWNESRGAGWAVQCAFVDPDTSTAGRVETVHEGRSMCLPPAIEFQGPVLWVAWPCCDGGALRIHVAKRTSRGWERLGPTSPPGVDAFRPSLAAGGAGAFLAWDQYDAGTYSVGAARIDSAEGWRHTLSGNEGERFLCPKLTAGDEAAHVTWLALRDVTDDWGIVDHFPFAPVACVRGDGVEYAIDPTNAADERIVADLRDGLLASDDHPYRGYGGLRRNPTLSLASDGTLWCLWEARLGHENTSTAGHLMGRQYAPGAGWTQPHILHTGGYAYCVPARWDGARIPVAYFVSDAVGMDVVESAFVDPDQGQPHGTDHAKWRRWRPVSITPDAQTRAPVTTGQGELRLFWADTHCHSEFSADAEGQVDELIHFARDVAGLDAVCIVDNDYYPHKALTEAEWRVHQALCSHFSRPGEFVVFPGWEYTYHRRDLDPSFNHRVIMYPGPGWPLWRRIDDGARVDRDLMDKLRHTPAVCYPHHCAYRIVDPELDRNVEVCSSWRVCIEETDFTLGQLRAGHRLGFIGSSDSHRGVPGLGGALTGVFATELTPDALFEAYRARRTIATQGHRVRIDFRAGDAFIGGEAEVSAPPCLDARVDAPEPIEFAELVRDGECIRRIEPDARTCDLHVEDGDCGLGGHFYFLRVKLVGDPSFNADPSAGFLGPFRRAGRYGHNMARARGPLAWTSPIWLNVV